MPFLRMFLLARYMATVKVEQNKYQMQGCSFLFINKRTECLIISNFSSETLCLKFTIKLYRDMGIHTSGHVGFWRKLSIITHIYTNSSAPYRHWTHHSQRPPQPTSESARSTGSEKSSNIRLMSHKNLWPYDLTDVFTWMMLLCTHVFSRILRITRLTLFP